MESISKDFADMFIERIRGKTPYPFFVVNKDGIIIAAHEGDRVGNFHEASFQMMRDGSDIMIVRPGEAEDYIGAKPGVDMPIEHNGKMVGALGITGYYEDVIPVVTAVKMTIEATLDYEALRESDTKKRNYREIFFSKLLENQAPENSKDLKTYAMRLGYQISANRVSILIFAEDKAEQVLQVIKECETLQRQDFAFVVNGSEVMLFRRLESKTQSYLSNLYEHCEKFCEPIASALEKQSIQARIFYGSVQSRLSNYHFAYSHCAWMMLKNHDRKMFYDYVDDYIKHLVPYSEFIGMFEAIASLFDEETAEVFMDVVEVLEKHNYNFVESSKELYLHKNTLFFRFNKIKNLLGKNPVKSSSDRAFVRCLCHYMKAQQSVESQDI